MSPLRWFFQTKRQHDDLTREMDAHIAERVDELVDGGMPQADARTQARREFGNVTVQTERSRDVWIAPWLTSVWQDLRYAVRSLRRQPGFTVSAVGILAIGIGLVMALVTAVNAQFLRRWPVPGADRIVVLKPRPAPGQQYGHVSAPEYRYLREHSRTVGHLSAWIRGGGQVSLDNVSTDVQSNFVTSNYFDMLGVAASQGRVFRPSEEDYVQPHPVAIISHRLWQGAFGAPSTIVGSTIRVRGVPFTVVGVMPDGFNDVGGLRIDLWMPLPSNALVYPGSGNRFDDPTVQVGSGVAGRLAEGASATQAEAELIGLGRQYRNSVGLATGGLDLVGTRRIEQDPDAFRRQLAPTTGAFVALGLVLLLVSANVGNLILARGLGRKREIAVRLAVGASRGRITRQLVTEALLLSLAASLAGTGIAWAALRTFLAAQSRLQDTSLLTPNLVVVGVAVALATLTTVIAGLLPSLRLTRTNVAAVASARQPGSQGAGRLRTVLLAAQLAASMVLLVGAGLMTRAVGHALLFDPGFDIHDVQVFTFSLSDATTERRAAFDRSLRSTLGSGSLPHAFTQFTAITDSGIMGPARITDGDRSRTVLNRPVSSAYFSVTGIRLVRGRTPSTVDDVDEVVINESAARSLWPDADSLGRQVVWGHGEHERRYTVVGIARDVPVRSLTTTEPVLYTPWREGGLLLVREPATAVIDRVRTIAQGIDPGAIVSARPLAVDIRVALSDLALGSRFAWAIGSLALVLATVGAFGVFAYMVEERRREIGVRMALGASSASVVRTVVDGARWPLAFGLGSGVVLSMLAAQLLRGTLYGLSPFDPITYAGVAGILTVAALVATWIPARRATRIDPAITLHGD